MNTLLSSLSEGVIKDNEYVNAPVRPEDKAPPDRRLLFSSPSLPLLAVCWILLLLIMGLRIYFSSVISEQNVKLKNEIQELKENFTKQIKDLEDNWEKFNVNRAQWTIDSYCPADTRKVRRCSSCQKGWTKIQKSCFVLHNSEAPPDPKTWEEARENCRGRGGDLFVVHDEEEKNVIDEKITAIPVSNGYWMGLRVEGGTWKWIDGTNLTDTSWMEPPAEGHCAVSLGNKGWTSVKCDEKRTRICSQKALSVDDFIQGFNFYRK
uniref:C-type lectin domain-containing protein n=1 Tax=Gasterosteus aculeatus aculeatus TaxID=481459 RepID=G3N5C9_GASAC|nr:secretory phospholipase A2 receptor-like [Gasterosteus aculeatus aculeatus]